MSTVTERVAAGAAFLDEHDPDWWRADVERAIDLESLDLESGSWCILGQRCPLNAVADSPEWVHHNFDAMALRLGTFSDRVQVNEWAAPLGFQAILPGNAPCDCIAEDECEACAVAVTDYDLLTAEWKRIITGRRATS